MEFKPINTQEEFDAAIQSRLDRQAAKLKTDYEGKYKDFDTYKEKAGKYDEMAEKNYPGQIEALQQQLSAAQEQLSTAQEKISANDKIVSDLTARAVTAETANLRAKVAHAHNIPFELAERLAGTTEAEMNADAEALAKFVTGKQEPPLASTETHVAANKTDAALMQMAAALGAN